MIATEHAIIIITTVVVAVVVVVAAAAVVVAAAADAAGAAAAVYRSAQDKGITKLYFRFDCCFSVCYLYHGFFPRLSGFLGNPDKPSSPYSPNFLENAVSYAVTPRKSEL